MNKDGMYNRVVQEYLHFNTQKRLLMQDQEKINAQLKVVEDILCDLNDILCRHGKHVYEHFEENKTQESEE